MIVDSTFHIHVASGDIGRTVLLPGDPGRVEALASFLTDAREVGRNREFVTWTGALDGVPVSVCSTGIGGPSAAIAMEELISLGADTFIRVGTCGGIDTAVEGGDTVIATAAVRQEGTGNEYASPLYPAASDFTVTRTLVDAFANAPDPVHIGVVQSKDAFYGQHDPQGLPNHAELIQRWEMWKRLGVLCSEMECAALFLVAAARRVRCGAVLHVVWNQERHADGLPTHRGNDEELTRKFPLILDAVRRLRTQNNVR